MSESDNLQKLGESLRSVMGSPEFEGILKSFGAGNTNGDSAYRAGGTGAAQAAGSAGGTAQNEIPAGGSAQNAGSVSGAVQGLNHYSAPPLGTGGGTGGVVPDQVPTAGGTGGINIPPELIKNLPSVISALSGMGLDPAKLAGMMSGMGAGTGFGQSQGSPALPVSAGGGGDKDKQRRALLGAIRPYLGDNRQRIVDSMLQLEKLTGLLGTFSDFNSGNK